MKYQVKVGLKIQKPLPQVFDAVYDPKKLSKYFTTGGASAPMEGGTTVTWDFADFPGAFPVYVRKAVRNKLIVFEWGAATGGNNRAKMEFKRLGPRDTKFTVTESGWPKTEKGLKACLGNNFGWSQFVCCLKAYVEYGINLRKGAF